MSELRDLRYEQRVIVRGRHYGTVRGIYVDGDPYVVFDDGSAGTVPASEVAPVEDKDFPREQVERK